MSVRTVVVAHRESLAAQGIAAALGRYPALVLVGIATTAEETERYAEQADAVAIDDRIPGAVQTVGRLRKRGVRVVVIGEATPGQEEEAGVVVGVDATMGHLASALAPGAQPLGSGMDGLSNREAQVLRLAAKGHGGQADRSFARDQSEDGGATQDAGLQATRRAEPGRGGGRADRERGASVEPIHYLRALRRRWWVIAASVVVACAAAWVTTVALAVARRRRSPGGRRVQRDDHALERAGADARSVGGAAGPGEPREPRDAPGCRRDRRTSHGYRRQPARGDTHVYAYDRPA